MDNQAAFLDECDALNVPCAGLEDLPAALRWTFDAIKRDAGPPDEAIAMIIHRLCLALLEDHVRILGAAQHRAELLLRLELGERLVRRIAVKQPVRRRCLIRTFDNQKVELYRPVLDHLVREGVLVEEPRNVFRLGACQFETMRARWLADPDAVVLSN